MDINKPESNKDKEAFMKDKKISYFIVEEYLNRHYEEGFKDTLKFWIEDLQSTIQKYNRYKLFVNFLDIVYNRTVSILYRITQRKKKRSILFESSKHSSLIIAAKKHYTTKMIVNGRSDRMFAIKHFVKYISVNDLEYPIYNYLVQKNENFLYDLVKNVKRKLKTAKPDFIILWNDSLPIERAIVLASKELSITTIEIQHGIYQSNSPLTEGRVDDYVFVWGKYFKNLYIEQGIRKLDEIYVLGYPYSIERNIENYNRKEKIVCYLGQNFEKYDNSLLKIKVDTINRLNKTCINLNLGFVYRPHPSDDVKLLKNKLPKVKFTPKGEKLVKAFEKYEIFISFNSSALIEAAMRSKICIQLMNLHEGADNFEKLGVCTKSFGTIAELEEYLKMIANSSDLSKFKVNFNNNYIDILNDPRKRFLKIIDEIGKTEKMGDCFEK